MYDAKNNIYMTDPIYANISPIIGNLTSYLIIIESNLMKKSANASEPFIILA